MKSLMKALDVIELFLKNKEELALSEIAKSSGMSKATVSRIVQALVSRGYLRQRERRGKYSLGTIYFEFSGLIKTRTRLRNVAMPHLMNLSQTVKESVGIAYFDGKDGVYTESFYESGQSGNLLRVSPNEGVNLSLYNTSMGKILLADMSEDEQEKYFNSKTLVKATPRTITDIAELKKQLIQIKQQGVAYDDEEYTIGVKALAAGIKDAEDHFVGAITLIAPAIRLDEKRMNEMEPLVKSCAETISRELGNNHYRRSP